MKTQQNSVTINLDLIEASETNEIFRGEKDLCEKSLRQFAESIKLDGVLQPIIVRPKENEEGKFILIAGERRWRASKIAGLTDIPCTIKNVSSDEAFKLQMVENLQREGIHPLNEAEGFKRILDNDPSMSTKALALMVSKSEAYIVQRLKLLDLIPQGKKDFKLGKMNIGHALIIARLNEEDQKCAMKHITQQGGYGSIEQLREFIERNIMNDLAQAPFNLEDDKLTDAGACIMCPKRSGFSRQLFSDIKQKDRCMDRGCFLLKCHQHLINLVNKIIETQPEVYFLCDYTRPDERILDLLSGHKLTPLREYTDFHNAGSGEKVKGLWISGNNTGKMQRVFLSQYDSSKEKSNSEAPEALIANIKGRVKQSRELDEEKVYAKILESLKAHETQLIGCKKRLLPEEEAFLWFVILDKAKWSLQEELRKAIVGSKNSPEKLYNALRNLSMDKKAFLLRKVMLDQYGGLYPNSDYGFIIRKIARAYKDIDIKAFENEQNEIRIKREERAKQRILTLRKSKRVPEAQD